MLIKISFQLGAIVLFRLRGKVISYHLVNLVSLADLSLYRMDKPLIAFDVVELGAMFDEFLFFD